MCEAKLARVRAMLFSLGSHTNISKCMHSATVAGADYPPELKRLASEINAIPALVRCSPNGARSD
jgi:hypothetical protein